MAQITVFNLFGKLMHIGVLASRDWMLYMLAALTWRNRAEGIYRWRGDA